MPTYEYECKKCGHEFEVFQRITAEPVKKCPKCKAQVRRKIGSGAGLLFKGSGFYITDYRSEGYRNAAQADKDRGKSEKTSDGKAGDTAKSAAKTNSKPTVKSDTSSKKSASGK